MKIKLSKKLSLLLIALGFSCVAMAQTEPQFSQYMFNRMSYNPGYAGSSGSICASAMYRQQWFGLKLDNPTGGTKAGYTPTDILFTFDMPVKFLHGGLGFTVVSDKIGYRDNLQLSVDYAFRMFWGEGNLSAGVELNVVNSKLDKSSLIGNDPNDPLLSGLGDAATMIDGSVGIYYQVPGKYYLGLSVKNLLAAHSDEIQFTNARTVYAMGGYEYTPSSAPSIRIKPSALFKTANFSRFQADLSCLIDYRNAFWGGMGYRAQDAIYLLAGVHWKQLRVGFAYDITTSRLGTFKPGRSMGTAEVYLKFCFKVVVPRKPNTSYGNTIYLL
jgi:type IX secretion system PorP/SprF family membrane protein